MNSPINSAAQNTQKTILLSPKNTNQTNISNSWNFPTTKQDKERLKMKKYQPILHEIMVMYAKLESHKVKQMSQSQLIELLTISKFLDFPNNKSLGFHHLSRDSSEESSSWQERKSEDQNICQKVKIDLAKDSEPLRKFTQIFRKQVVSNSLDKMAFDEKILINKYHVGLDLPEIENTHHGFSVKYGGNVQRFSNDIHSLKNLNRETQIIMSNQLNKKLSGDITFPHQIVIGAEQIKFANYSNESYIRHEMLVKLCEIYRKVLALKIVEMADNKQGDEDIFWRDISKKSHLAISNKSHRFVQAQVIFFNSLNTQNKKALTMLKKTLKLIGEKMDTIFVLIEQSPVHEEYKNQNNKNLAYPIRIYKQELKMHPDHFK